jgi:hypothetical protein
VDDHWRLSTVDLLWLLDHEEPSVRAAAVRAVPLLEAWTDPVLACLDRARTDGDKRVEDAAVAVLAEREPAQPGLGPSDFQIVTSGVSTGQAPPDLSRARAAILLDELRDVAIPSFLHTVASDLTARSGGKASWTLPDGVPLAAKGGPQELVRCKTEHWVLSLTEDGDERVLEIVGKAPELAGRRLDATLGGLHACSIVLALDGDNVRGSEAIPPSVRTVRQLKPDSLVITVA